MVGCSFHSWPVQQGAKRTRLAPCPVFPGNSWFFERPSPGFGPLRPDASHSPLEASSVMRRMFVLCVCVIAFLDLPAARAGIEAGAAMRVITPDPLLPVSGGMCKPRPTKAKRGELTARAVVFREGEVAVA